MTHFQRAEHATRRSRLLPAGVARPGRAPFRTRRAGRKPSIADVSLPKVPAPENKKRQAAIFTQHRQQKSSRSCFLITPSAFAVRRGVDRFPSTPGATSRRQRLVVRHRRIVRPQTTARTDFLKNTTTIPGIGTGFHAFAHWSISYQERVSPASETLQNHKRSCQAS